MKKDAREKVIFRRRFDPYMNIMTYMCIFPDDPANPGRICYVDIWKNPTWCHDCYDEADISCVYEYPIIHKSEPEIPALVEALKDIYGGDYKVVEKIRRR